MGKNNKLIPIFIIAIAFLSISTGTFMLLNNKDKESGNNNNVEPVPPINNDKVEFDDFTFAFLKMESNENNILNSPLSIKYALKMLSDGAAGETKKEIDNLLGNNPISKYQNIDNVLSLANSVFIRDSYKDSVKDDYINTVKSNYNAEIIYDAFENADNINKWIEDHTFGLIKNMLSDDQVQERDTEMFLINALAIDMGWDIEFDSQNTSPETFTKSNKEEINVAMMSMTTNTDKIKYHKDDAYSVVSLPLKEYNGTQLEFIAIMSNGNNLTNVLTSDSITETIKSLVDKLHTVDKEKLNIKIPRFDFEYKTNLKDDLMSLGVETAFTGAADFSNMSREKLMVSDALHKANIKLTEKGVKAAAATVIIMKDNAAFVGPTEEEIVNLHFDKPFIFLIRDTKTNEVWFTGSVYEPQLWDQVKDDYNS